LSHASPELSQLIRQIEDRISIEVEEAGLQSRREVAEELNQMMRRLRQCRSTEEVASWVLDSAASFGGPAALFEVMGAKLRGVRSRGFPATSAEPFEELETAFDEAPAFAHSIQERETVVAIGAEAEVSMRIANALPVAPGDKVYLFPMVIQENVVAILYVTEASPELTLGLGDASASPAPTLGLPSTSTVDRAALELLTGAAAGAAQILASQEGIAVRQAAPELIGIQGVDMRTHASAATSDIRRQALEAQARWFARTEVARMRLFRRKALEQGRMERDIYSALKPEIEAARRTYQQDYLEVSPRIADYLHRELVSLAHDDANVLGPEYPGSLA
jgi:hypothetical protein